MNCLQNVKTPLNGSFMSNTGTSLGLNGHPDAVKHHKNCKCVLQTFRNLVGVWVYALFVESSQKKPLIELIINSLVFSSVKYKYKICQDDCV